MALQHPKTDAQDVIHWCVMMTSMRGKGQQCTRERGKKCWTGCPAASRLSDKTNNLLDMSSIKLESGQKELWRGGGADSRLYLRELAGKTRRRESRRHLLAQDGADVKLLSCPSRQRRPPPPARPKLFTKTGGRLTLLSLLWMFSSSRVFTQDLSRSETGTL